MRIVLRFLVVFLILFTPVSWAGDINICQSAVGDSNKLTLKKGEFTLPSSPTDDEMFFLSHVSETAMMELDAGEEGDTFFVVFHPPAPCSVKYVEIKWDCPGEILSFAARFNPQCAVMYPDGRAPPRNYGAPTPIGEYITSPASAQALGTGEWEILPLPSEFAIGNSSTMETELFGIGFVKLATQPYPLAQFVTDLGYTYTWFGGAWSLNPWGAYSINFLSSIVEVMMRVAVIYPWGMPVIAQNISQQSDTYNQTGPFHITCALFDDGAGVTSEDSIELVYSLNGIYEYRVEMVDEGGDLYGADININGAPGDFVVYWIHTVDDEGMEYESPSRSFQIVSPANPASDILFIAEGLSDGRIYPYEDYFQNSHWNPEIWNAVLHKGVDGSVVNFGWNNIVVAADGGSAIPALDGSTPFADFLDGGGNLLLIDQDYFAGNGLPAFGFFIEGDFARDYFGISDYANDPWFPSLPPDTVYRGCAGDPVSGSFAVYPYETFCLQNGMSQGDIKPDCFSTSGAAGCFIGEDYGSVQGCRYDNGFKTVFLAFMAEAGCMVDDDPYSPTYGMLLPTYQFTTLMDNVLNWFGAMEVEDINSELSPAALSLDQNYPNPFNSQTCIMFNLVKANTVILEVLNLRGRKVATLVDGMLEAGWNTVIFDASGLSTGIYFYRLKSGDSERMRKMMLLK